MTSIIVWRSPWLPLAELDDLLVWGNAFNVLNLRLDVVDGVASVHIDDAAAARQRFHEDLRAQLDVQLKP